MSRHVLGSALGALLCGCACCAAADESAVSPSTDARAARRAELLEQRRRIQQQLDALDAAVPETAPVPAAKTDAVALHAVTVSAARQTTPTAQTATTLDRSRYDDVAAQSVAELLVQVPGVTLQRGNGPRDVSVSLRGSNTRQTFGVRNLKLYEDGFPVTQPDGLGRTDLSDPHVYGAIDVERGPSSALYGNYATGGAIDFRTRAAADIDGVEAGADFGSYDYYNQYVTVGGVAERGDYVAFVSNVRGNPLTAHADYNTLTANALAHYRLTPRDRLTFKFIDNELDANLSIRLSLNQFRQNPYQLGCAGASSPGCASVSLFSNGYNGARQSLTAEQAGLKRNDRRTIVGARWEHDFDAATSLRTQLVFDNRDIKQPTSATAGLGTYPSFNWSADLQHGGSLWLRPSLLQGGVHFNYQNLNAYTYNLTPAGGATLGGLTQTVTGNVLNTGLHLREEWQFAPQWSAVLGAGGEYTLLKALASNYSYPANANPTLAQIPALRVFFNGAPEAALQFKPDSAWTLHTRVAGGYGTPQPTNLFVNAQGQPGNNTALQTQTNLGVDVGAEWSPTRSFSASLTGFREWFHNELVSQSAGAGLQNYSYNAPRSTHQGIEAALDWTLLPGLQWTTSYLYMRQTYDDYIERLSAGTQSASFDRSGKDLPGVVPQTLNTRLSYTQRSGRFSGAGAYVAYDWRTGFVVDNANLLEVPGYHLWNAGVDYKAPAGLGVWSGLQAYVQVQNLFDTVYIASAGNISNSINSTTGAQNGTDVLAATGGSIYAGIPRSVFGGLRWHF